MYRYYCEVHAPVNPLTAPFAEFCALLPGTALYAPSGGGIGAAAFVEENEIAYVCSNGAKEFSGFARSLLSRMFERYGEILFEADDTDPAATELRAMFSIADGISWDTYVRPRRP